MIVCYRRLEAATRVVLARWLVSTGAVRVAGPPNGVLVVILGLTVLGERWRTRRVELRFLRHAWLVRFSHVMPPSDYSILLPAVAFPNTAQWRRPLNNLLRTARWFSTSDLTERPGVDQRVEHLTVGLPQACHTGSETSVNSPDVSQLGNS
jgi:hypothetical protein